MTTSRRDFLARSVQLGVLLGAGVPLLQACGSSDTASSEPKHEAHRRRPEARGGTVAHLQLRLVRRTPTSSPTSRSKYGVKTEITTFTTDTEALTKLAIGRREGRCAPLDGRHVDRPPDQRRHAPAAQQDVPHEPRQHQQQVRRPLVRQGRRPTRCRTRSSAPGIGLPRRPDRPGSRSRQQGWDTLWKATKFKGQVSVLDDEREALMMAMLRKGLSPT